MGHHRELRIAGSSVFIQNRIRATRSDFIRQRHRPADLRSRLWIRLRHVHGAPTALRADGPVAHGRRNHRKFMGKIKNSDPRVEPGWRNGHERITCASAARPTWNLSGHALEKFGLMFCCAARDVERSRIEIVSTDLESRYRLRRLLVDALSRAHKEGSGLGRGPESVSQMGF